MTEHVRVKSLFTYKRYKNHSKSSNQTRKRMGKKRLFDSIGLMGRFGCTKGHNQLYCELSKGSIFVKSMDVSDVSKDANLLFRILNKMVDEVGEENVVQVITYNVSA